MSKLGAFLEALSWIIFLPVVGIAGIWMISRLAGRAFGMGVMEGIVRRMKSGRRKDQDEQQDE